MEEEKLFFSHIKDICIKDVITCSSGDNIQLIARLMKENNISGVIVTERNVPVGVITDRDLRNKVLADNIPTNELKAFNIMSSPVISIQENQYVFDAVYLMTKNKIHRLVVVDEMGQLYGIITDTDIIKQQTNTPLYFIRDLEYAHTLDDLKKINKKIVELIRYLLKSGIKTRDLVRFISHVNDSIIIRLINLLVQEKYYALPSNFSFLVLGSEGRMEQTLKTDQDNAIVYEDSFSERDKEIIEDFSKKLIDALIYIGVPECPGGIMAKNPQWRRSYSEWAKALKNWISEPTAENILNYSMFSDLRAICGENAFEKKLKFIIKSMVEENEIFLAHMAKNILRFPPPLGFLGRIKTESSGNYKGAIDIKKAAIFSITEGVKVLALKIGELNGGTLDKIQKLMEHEVLPYDELLELQTSYNFLINLRLKNNLNQFFSGKELSNCIFISDLNNIEKDRLKIALSIVKRLHSFLTETFSLNFIQ